MEVALCSNFIFGGSMVDMRVLKSNIRECLVFPVNAICVGMDF